MLTCALWVLCVRLIDVGDNTPVGEAKLRPEATLHGAHLFVTNAAQAPPRIVMAELRKGTKVLLDTGEVRIGTSIESNFGFAPCHGMSKSPQTSLPSACLLQLKLVSLPGNNRRSFASLTGGSMGNDGLEQTERTPHRSCSYSACFTNVACYAGLAIAPDSSMATLLGCSCPTLSDLAAVSRSFCAPAPIFTCTDLPCALPRLNSHRSCRHNVSSGAEHGAKI